MPKQINFTYDSPSSIANWKYDINQHGDMGWYYFKDGRWRQLPDRNQQHLSGFHDAVR